MAYLFQVTALDKQKKVVVTTFPTKDLAMVYAASVRGKVKRVSNKPKINVSVTSCIPATLNMQKESEKAFDRVILARSQARDISAAYESFAKRQEAKKALKEKAKQEEIAESQNEIELDMALSMLKMMQEESEMENAAESPFKYGY
jgi:hypothetical protein